MRRKRPFTQAEITLRFLGIITGVLNPCVLLLHIVIVTSARLFVRQHRLGAAILTAGLAGVGVGVWLGWHTLYITPWTDLYAAVGAHSFDTYVSKTVTVQTVVIECAQENWHGWVLDQAPFALCVALVTSGAYLAWRDYYSDDWRNSAGAESKPASVRAIERAKKAQNAAIERAEPLSRVAQMSIPLGIDAYTAKPISVDVGAWRTHAIVCGSTGLGKTQGLMRIMHSFTLHPQAAKLRCPLVVVDMKADPDLATYAQRLAQRTGRDFYQVTIRQGSYNPLSGLCGDEIADSIYETVFANDPTLNTHYATLSRRLLQTAAGALIDLAGSGAVKVGAGRAWQVSMLDLTDLLSLNTLRSIQTDLTPPAAQRLHTYISDVEAADNAQDVGDVRDRMAVIMHTSAGEILSADGFSLEHAITHGGIIIFSLDAAGAPETARTIGTLAIQDLTATFGRLQRQGWGKHHICPVILDEFSALATPKVADLYARARSAGGSIILSTQDIDADLEAVSPEFAASVRTNANIWIVLRQTRADVAEAIARDLGSQTTWKETVQITDDFDLLGGLHAASGVGSLREVEEFILHPSQLKNLPQGAAYLFVKIPTGSLNAAHAATTINRIHINAPAPIPPKLTPTACQPNTEETDEVDQEEETPPQEQHKPTTWDAWAAPPEDDLPPF